MSKPGPGCKVASSAAATEVDPAVCSQGAFTAHGALDSLQERLDKLETKHQLEMRGAKKQLDKTTKSDQWLHQIITTYKK